MNYTEMEAKVIKPVLDVTTRIPTDCDAVLRCEKPATMNHGALLRRLCKKSPMAPLISMPSSF